MAMGGPHVKATAFSDAIEHNIDLPDIYLIVLDGYTSSDVLKESFNLDNTEFIRKLREIGFYVANCANSNYPLTDLSMGSIFEMNYFHNIYSNGDNIVLPLLSSTLAINVLTQNNYQIIAFDNFYFDHLGFSVDQLYSKEEGLFGSINEFEQMLVKTSILRLLVDMEGFLPESIVDPFTDDIYLSQYRDVTYALETVTQLPKNAEPKFVYMHIMATHDPFVFLPDGTMGNSKMGEEQSYRDTVEYINSVIPTKISNNIGGEVL